MLMEIPGLVANLQVAGGELLQREGEEFFIVGLEVDFAAQLQRPAVLVEEAPVGQTALGVLAPGPGVAEVDIEQVDLIVGKYVLMAAASMSMKKTFLVPSLPSP